jgi:putative ABC transport system substrate-binding protein
MGHAQTTRVIARIGCLPSTGNSPGLIGLRDGLKQIGYVEGDNLLLAFRDGGPRNERLDELARELLGLPVDVLVTQGPYGLEAAKRATTSVPIVFAGVGANFPGLTDGGNVTGVAEEIVESTVKRLAVLKETVPGLARIGILQNPRNYGTAQYLRACQEWANTAKVSLKAYDVQDPDDVLSAFRLMITDGMQGVIAFTDSVIFRQRDVIVQTAIKYRLPGVYPYREWVEAGGLLSYGPDLKQTLQQQIPPMIDRILKGTKPGDIPVQRPNSSLYVNLESARVLGVTVPQAIRDRAIAVESNG